MNSKDKLTWKNIMTMRLILTYSLSKMKRWRMQWKRFIKIIMTSINKKFKPSNKHFFKSFRRPLYLDQKNYQMILKLVSYQPLPKLCNLYGINGKALKWKIAGLVLVMNLLSFSFSGFCYQQSNGFGSFQFFGSNYTKLN